jgi:hypothetical protein
MNMKAIILSVILGLAVPTLPELVLQPSAMAGVQFPSGNFANKNWLITLSYNNNTHQYSGLNLKTGKTLNLSGATVSGDSQRRVYTWNNNGYLYQVSWQPNDPNFIRLKVFAPNKKEVLNELLEKHNGEI